MKLVGFDITPWEFNGKTGESLKLHFTQDYSPREGVKAYGQRCVSMIYKGPFKIDSVVPTLSIGSDYNVTSLFDDKKRLVCIALDEVV